MLDAVLRWLLQVAHQPLTTAELLEELWPRVVDAGVPLGRALIAVRTIHPQLVGLGYMWRRGRGVRSDEHPHGELEQPRFLHSPLRAIFDGGPPLRLRLDGDAPLPYPVLEELRADGMTDYLGLPLRFSNGRAQALTLTTDAPAGFSGAAAAALGELAAALALVIEVREMRRVAVTLLDTYVGPRAGAKILDGWIRRGDLALIDAVVLCGDLRGFTPLTVELAPADVVALLNQYFGAVCAPLREAGGEILKFIGDGVLVAFDVDGFARVGDACAAALSGAERALEALAALGACRVGGRELPLRMGVALHVGQVAFGNVGAASRLDFTVIGRAVNVASRLAGLCSRVERTLLVSSAFARALPDGALHVGSHSVRGLPEPEEVYTYALPRDRS